MAERPGLHPIGPDEELDLPSRHPEPAYKRAESALNDAEERYSAGDHESADVLAAIGQGWATLALTEPRPDLQSEG